MRTIVLLAGGLCTVMGAVLILVKDKVEGLLWFGIAIQLLGTVLVWLALRKPKSQVPEKPTPRQGVILIVGIGIILLLQFIYLIWWSKTNR